MIFCRFAATAIVALAILYAPDTPAQKYPDRPVRLVSAFPPGGGADILARIMSQKFTELWGVSMYVENKIGASGNIGTDFVAKSEPNGYTLLLSPNGLTINPTVMKELPFNVVTDLAPIGMVATSPLVLAINNKVPARTLKELIALAKAEPGKLNYGSSGPGTSQHLAGELINLTADIKTVHIPYKSSGAILQALITDELQIGFVSYNSVEGFVRQGQVRLLATLGAVRDPTVPDLPTMAEAGLPGCEVDIWYAMFAPSRTPAVIVRQLNADLKRILEVPGMTAELQRKGFNPAFSSPEAMSEVIRKDLARWKVVADRINLRI